MPSNFLLLRSSMKRFFFPAWRSYCSLQWRSWKAYGRTSLVKNHSAVLTSVTIENCPSLLIVFPSCIVDRMENLTKIETSECRSLGVIFELSMLGANKKHKPLMLSRLKEVRLFMLSKLRHFVKSDSRVLGFPSLRTISAYRCHDLTDLFPHPTARTLDELECMNIDSCDNMQQVIAKEEGEIKKSGGLKFRRLRSLILDGLKSLHSFSSGSCAYEFPSLTNLSIMHCYQLKGFIFRPQTLSTGKQFEKVEDASPVESVESSTQPLFDEEVLFPTLESLALTELPKVKEIWDDGPTLESFNKLQSLQVCDCSSLLSVFKCNLLLKLVNLESLIIMSCQLVQEIFDFRGLKFSENISEVLPRLTDFHLIDLPSLRCIWNGNLGGMLGFQNLALLEVQDCHNLGFLLSSAMAKTLSQIGSIRIANCMMMKEIILEEKGEETTDSIEFKLLTFLSVEELPNLTSFCRGNYSSDCPALKQLKIVGCPKMKAFSLHGQNQEALMATYVDFGEAFSKDDAEFPSDFAQPLFDNEVTFPSLEELWVEGITLEELWHREVPAKSIGKLKLLDVKRCAQLSCVVPSFLFRRLCSLRYLTVKDCSSMECIYEPEETMDKIVFPKLSSLKLHSLPKLSSFCHGKRTLECPSLKRLVIKYCEAVKVIAADQPFCKGLDTVECMRDVANQLPLFLFEKVSFPSLKELVVAHMDNLVTLWNGEASPDSFSKLKKVEVESCEELLSIIPSKMLLKFQNLERLIIRGCNSLEVIYDMQGWIENSNIDAFVMVARLRELTLDHLAKLKHIWSRDAKEVTPIFGKLDSVQVSECER